MGTPAAFNRRATAAHALLCLAMNAVGCGRAPKNATIVGGGDHELRAKVKGLDAQADRPWFQFRLTCGRAGALDGRHLPGTVIITFPDSVRQAGDLCTLVVTGTQPADESPRLVPVDGALYTSAPVAVNGQWLEFTLTPTFTAVTTAPAAVTNAAVMTTSAGDGAPIDVAMQQGADCMVFDAATFGCQQ